ncbi:MAG: VWA domain-containing protein, partial [bacterium]|nr:VWA domain-containing protein [bacterium]
MKKSIKEKFNNAMKILFAIITLITSFGYTSLALALQPTVNKGDVVDSSYSTGSISNEGDVKFTKKVTKDNTSEDIYEITLSVEGKEKTVNESKTAPVYAVVVFDKSGSMENYYCDYITSIFNGCNWGDYIKKMDNAIDGAKNFATSLLSSFSNAQIALVTFSDKAQTVRGFSNSNLNDVNFGKASGSTALGAGISQATNLLNSVKVDANKYIVIISDGEPTTSNHTSAANIAKAKGYEIFAIGYEDDGKTLKSLVSNPQDKHYSDGNAFNISEVFTDIVGNIEVKIPAATNVTITDSIAEGFTYVDGSANPSNATVNGNIISFKLSEVPAEGKTVSFKIKATNLKEGYNITNDFAKVEYTDVNGKNDSKEIIDSPKVYWEEDKYAITVNYYKDEIKASNLLGTVSSKPIYKLNDKIDSSLIDVNAKKTLVGEGYQDGVIATSMPYTIINNENIINVVYVKKNDLSYTVEYYKDTTKISKDEENTFGNQTYHNQILENEIEKNKYKPILGYQNGIIETTMPYTIQDGENKIIVRYNKRTDMSYTVKYVEKGNGSILDDEIRTNKTFQETYTELAKDAPFGYRLIGNDTQNILIDEDNKILTFYYEKRDDFKYTVKYLDEDGNTLKPQKVVTNKKYLDTCTEKAIKIDGYNVITNDNNPNPRTIIISQEDMTITFFYTKRTDLTYKINYYEDDINGKLLGTEIIENQTFDELINISSIDV